MTNTHIVKEINTDINYIYASNFAKMSLERLVI